MILREATAADRDAVTALALAFHQSTPYGQLLDVQADRIGVLFDLARADGVVLVAERDDVPGPGGPVLVAFLALVALEHTLSGDRYAEEAAWWVDPDSRGTLGPRLLARGEAWARAHGCVFLKMAAPVNSPVGSFYARYGYLAVETAFLKRLVA